MEAPQVNNGKHPDDHLNAKHFFWLPPDSPFGNFTSKLAKLLMRTDELNRRLSESFALWSAMRTNLLDWGKNYERHVFVLETCVFHMRRITDELLALTHCLSEKETVGNYPQKLAISDIGNYLHANPEERLAIFEPHIPMLETLNNIANSYKHSFINSDSTLVGLEEPWILALGLTYNNLAAGPKFYSVSCKELVLNFDHMQKDAMAWLKDWSDRNKT